MTYTAPNIAINGFLNSLIERYYLQFGQKISSINSQEDLLSQLNLNYREFYLRRLVATILIYILQIIRKINVKVQMEIEL